MGGIGQDYARQVAVDALGNVYTIGYFRDTVDFDPGPGTYNLISAGFDDIFISKLDANGNLVWAIRLGSSVSNDIGNVLALDPGGYLYVGGSFADTVDFDPGVGTYPLGAGSGGSDIFILKLDLSGNFVWAGKIGGYNGDGVRAINLDQDGNVILTGMFFTASDFDPGPGTFTIFTSGDASFVCKLTAAGNFVWAKHFEDAVNTGAVSLGSCVAGNGTIYTVGYFVATVDFDPGPATYNLTPLGTMDVFISALDSAGNFQWAKKIGGAIGNATAPSVASDAAGNIYLTGQFDGPVDFNPGIGNYYLTPFGGYDIFVCKLDAAGNFIWAKQSGGLNFDGGASIFADSSGNTHIAGSFSTMADFDPGSGTYNLVSAGLNDIFISQLDSAGNFQGAVKMGGKKPDYCVSICLDNSNNIYACGSFQDTCDFDPGSGIYNLFSAAGNDAHVVKLNTVTGINDLQNAASEITVFPNPGNGVINIVSSTPVKEINISNLMAQSIYRAKPDKSNFSVNVNKEGVYCVQLTTGNRTITKKIIVSK